MVAAPKLNPASPLNDGLLAWYLAHPAYFGGTVWPDLSGNGNTGTLVNLNPLTCWVSDGPVSGFGSMDFGGTQDYLESPGSAAVLGDAPRTVSLWARLGPGDDRLLRWGVSGNGLYYAIEPTSGGVVRVARWGGGVNGTIPVLDDTWRHIAITYSGAGVHDIFVDGTHDVQRTDSIALDTRPGPVFIGLSNPNEDRNSGRFSDVRIYNRVLSPTEIAAYYTESLGGYKTVLLSDGPVLSSPHATNHLDRSQLLSSPHLLGSFP